MRPDGHTLAQELERICALRLRPTRDATGHHFVEGLRQVFNALDAGLRPDPIVYCETLAPTIAQMRVRLAKKAGARVLRVTPEQFRRISVATHASGVGAVVRQHWSSLDEADPAIGLCWLGIGVTRSPGNLGTLLRTAEAAGAAGVIVLEPDTDPFDDRVVRASMGGIFGLQFARASHEEFAHWSRRHGCCVVGTSPRAEIPYTEVDIESPLVVLFGEERQGLTERERRLCTHTATIPMAGRADSLNLGVAAGVVLFDVLRRRSGVERRPTEPLVRATVRRPRVALAEAGLDVDAMDRDCRPLEPK